MKTNLEIVRTMLALDGLDSDVKVILASAFLDDKTELDENDVINAQMILEETYQEDGETYNDVDVYEFLCDMLRVIC